MVQLWGLATGEEAMTGDFATAIINGREVVGLMAEDDEGRVFVSFVDLIDDDPAPTIFSLQRLSNPPLKITDQVIVELDSPFASVSGSRSLGALVVSPQGEPSVIVQFHGFNQSYLTPFSLVTGRPARASAQWRVVSGWKLLIHPEGRKEPYVVAAFPPR